MCFKVKILSVDEPLRDIAVSVDSPVAQEGPPASYALGAVDIDRYDGSFFFVAGLVVQFTLRSGYERVPPEAYAAGLPRGVGFVSGAVHGHDVQSVGYSVPTLHSYPCLALLTLLVAAVGLFVTYGRGVNQ